MPVPLFCDENFPGPVIDELRRRGVDVTGVVEKGIRGATDSEVFARAIDSGRVLVTHDTDFLRLARERLEKHHAFPGLVYIPQRKLTTGQLVRELEAISLVGNREDFEDKIVWLPL